MRRSPMNEQLRSQSQARLAQIETRLLEIQTHLAEGRERQALDVVCDLRSQIDALFVALLVGHLHKTFGEPEGSREFETLIRQLLTASE